MGYWHYIVPFTILQRSVQTLLYLLVYIDAPSIWL